jgi:hypothetical protein
VGVPGAAGPVGGRLPEGVPLPADAGQVAYYELGALLRWPGNPKEHDLDALGEALDVNGFVDPLLVDEGTGKMVEGHGRLTKLERLRDSGAPAPERIVVHEGRWYVPVIRGMKLKDPQKHLLAANRIVELGGYDNQALAAILAQYPSAEGALAGTGFYMEDLAKFVALNRLGKNPEEKKGIFDNALIKQIVLYFKSAVFDDLVERLNQVMAGEGLDNHSEVFVHLLSFYEENREKGRGRAAPARS